MDPNPHRWGIWNSRDCSWFHKNCTLEFARTLSASMRASRGDWYHAMPMSLQMLLDDMPSMTDEARVEVLETIMERYCKSCGCLQGPRQCQCANDA